MVNKKDDNIIIQKSNFLIKLKQYNYKTHITKTLII